MGDATLTNESMHLAEGLMAAGFCGVIGTLWATADDDSALVAKGVYRRLFKPADANPDVAQAAYALHVVVQAMRKRNLGFHRWMQLVHMGV
ncbi:hypothetical protein BD779DRAFT_1500178 [Infundibulicybe gibba]|nr:hypothetical protein BD779DRAFT_1500178 [Infundibulicybe gibba]